MRPVAGFSLFSFATAVPPQVRTICGQIYKPAVPRGKWVVTRVISCWPPARVAGCVLTLTSLIFRVLALQGRGTVQGTAIASTLLARRS